MGRLGGARPPSAPPSLRHCAARHGRQTRTPHLAAAASAEPSLQLANCWVAILFAELAARPELLVAAKTGQVINEWRTLGILNFDRSQALFTF